MPERMIPTLAKSIRLLAIATMVLFLFSITVSILGYVANRHRISENSTARRALCIFRSDLSRRIEASKEFLIQYPKGIDGITPATIVKSIHDQQRTLDALQALRCKNLKEGGL